MLNGHLPTILNLFAIVGAGVGVALWVDGGQDALLAKLNAMDRAMGDVVHNLDKRIMANEAGRADRWRGQDQKIWASELQIRNPEINVPDPDLVVRSRSLTGG